MSAEQTVYNTLKNDAGVAALVGTRIYPLVLPQNPTYPAISYQRISTRPVQTRGGNGLAFVRMQVDCFATGYTAAKQLSDAVVSALAGTLEVGLMELWDDTLGLYRVSIDYQVNE